MKSFFKTKRFKALLAVVLVLSGFMVYSITTHGMGTIPSSLVSAVTMPFEQLASWVSGLADDVFGGFVLTSQLKEQVASMEEEIRTLREQQVDYAQIKSENEELRQYLDLKKENPREIGNIYYTQCWSIKWTIRFLPSKMNHLLVDICLKVFGASLTPFLLMVWMLPT